MKRSLQFRRVFVITRLLVTLGAALFVALASPSIVRAAIAVDVYQDMESGNAGDVLTAAIMNASSHPAASWTANSGTVWVSTGHYNNLPGPVTVGGVTYNGTGGSRTWVYNNNNANNYVQASFSSSSRVTIACFYTTASTVTNTKQYDMLVIWGQAGGFAVMQGVSPGGLNGSQLRSHSKTSDGTVTFGNPINVTASKSYWINLKYDSVAGASSLAVFDPANGYSQVGSTSTVASMSDTLFKMQCGRIDSHGPLATDTTQSWYGQMCIDRTNAAFPLIPSGGTDSTPPSAPGAVRDGTGTDVSTTGSTVQLSANWDASSDVQSGISGYQYAIGTSAGGTQTVNWTSLGNVTTVTKSGLTLTLGQTYYFSVKAVNGAGLTGSATNSNGQTVVSVGNAVYFSDNFESWTVHGGTWSSVNGESSTHTLNTSTDYAKAGSKSLKTTDTDTTAATGASLTKNFSPVISGDIYVRFFVFLPTGFGSANSTCARRIVRVYNDTGSYTVISLTGDDLAVYEVGGWSGTGLTAISENVWHCVELHVASPSASTPIQYWIDGTSAGTCTGAFSGASTFNSMQFGDVALATGTTNSTGTIYWDEVVVSNYYNGTNATTTYFSDNFDNWSVHGGAWSSTSNESANHTLNTSTDVARAGTKSLKITDSDTTATSGACLVKTFSPVISGDIYVRFYVYLPSGFGGANTNCSRRILQVYCGSNRGQISLLDEQPDMEEVGAWGNVTWPGTLSEAAWHCIEIHCTAPSASTTLEFWIDGTKNNSSLTANFSASSTWDHINFGDVVTGSGGSNGTGTLYFDEIVVSNAYNGPLP